MLSLVVPRVWLTPKLVPIGLILRRTRHDLGPVLIIELKAIPKYNRRPFIERRIVL